ncbi:MAG: hypothetical protein ACTSO3_12105 [Candidatus Heimdallarchaeaceae archaeon]
MNLRGSLMYSDERRQRIARIIELPIPMELFDLLEDLISHYGSPEKAILESIKSHHKEQFGTLEDFKINQTPPPRRVYRPINHMNTPVTEGKIAKIIENGKKFEEKTQKDLAKVDKLINQISDLPALTELRDEISSMKTMIENIGTSAFASPRTRSPRADLSSLDVSISESQDVLFDAPDRPLLESVLDSVLLFDDDHEEESDSEVEKTNDEKTKD